MEVDALPDFGIDAAMEFDIGGDFLFEHEFGMAASQSALAADPTRESGKMIKQVLHTAFSDFPFS
jgi:hypothetical protein